MMDDVVQYLDMWCSHFWCLLRVESISRRSKYCTASSYIAYKSACDRADQATVPPPPALIIRGRSYHNLGTNFTVCSWELIKTTSTWESWQSPVSTRLSLFWALTDFTIFIMSRTNHSIIDVTGTISNNPNLKKLLNYFFIHFSCTTRCSRDS